jgi:predicted  nucleic acid-binding Zn-ribbon protein
MNTIDTIIKILPLIFSIMQVIILFAIKFNDFEHYRRETKNNFDIILNKIEALEKTLVEVNKKIIEHESRISKIEGKLNGK